ncbi:S41 family peptidase [Commensalibacter oyaizuii]|uniref:S41 family peptidase n=1 Tax=Commensalibacter oyaizuii TaxID=3043873 RepID=A0ABT6Q0A8_9PROT|nr:S41 family peptidase [Commensalibacter sp. TBRC 16381]MDI2090525.1 S41 family peptidase [Commensalibacter sp. TBRC 16381]
MLLIIAFITAMSCSIALSQTPSSAQVSSKSFNKNTYINVIATALTFLQPRTLEEHTAKQLCLWGLSGLNAIDPAFSLKEEQNHLNLYQAQNLIYSAVLPPTPSPVAPDKIKQWSKIVVDMWSAAWDHSDIIRSAGEQGVIQAFFDELFDHMDPYSRYVGPSSASNDRDARDGGEASAGISVTKRGNSFIISSINTNGPAWDSGILVGQRLYKVDNKSTTKQSLDTVSKWLRGPENSSISLTVGFPRKKKIQTFHLKREAVPPATVFAFTSDNIIILKVTSFSTYTAEEISQYLDQATQDMKIKGLIIDLRGNRGGVLQQAITSAALLLNQGIAATTQGRNPDANHVWAVQGGDLTENVPIAVLVDGHTASAAEILAAALADHKRAVVIGSSTLGKGLVQTIAQLPDNSELFVTWSRVLAPLGWPIQGLGIIPQICTSRGQQFLDQQLANLKSIQASPSTYAQDVLASRKAKYPIPQKMLLRLRSACPSALGTDVDLDVAHTIILKPEIYKQAIDLIPN